MEFGGLVESGLRVGEWLREGRVNAWGEWEGMIHFKNSVLSHKSFDMFSKIMY